MTFFVVPAIETDALPKLCRAKHCTNSPYRDEVFCFRHLRYGGPLRQKKSQHPKELESWQVWIYFVQQGESGPIKIGKAKNVKRRINTLQTSNPYKLVLRAKIKASAEYEIELHNQFSEHRLEGEWFEPSEELIRFIEHLNC